MPFEFKHMSNASLRKDNYSRSYTYDPKTYDKNQESKKSEYDIISQSSYFHKNTLQTSNYLTKDYNNIIININFPRQNREFNELISQINPNDKFKHNVYLAFLFQFGKNKTKIPLTLLKIFTTHLHESHSLNSQNIGNACYGIQNLTANSEEEKELLKALAYKINTSSAELNAQHIGNACYGIQNLTANSEEEKKLLKALALKINRAFREFKPSGLNSSYAA